MKLTVHILASGKISCYVAFSVTATNWSTRVPKMESPSATICYVIPCPGYVLTFDIMCRSPTIWRIQQAGVWGLLYWRWCGIGMNEVYPTLTARDPEGSTRDPPLPIFLTSKSRSIHINLLPSHLHDWQGCSSPSLRKSLPSDCRWTTRWTQEGKHTRRGNSVVPQSNSLSH